MRHAQNGVIVINSRVSNVRPTGSGLLEKCIIGRENEKIASGFGNNFFEKVK